MSRSHDLASFECLYAKVTATLAQLRADIDVLGVTGDVLRGGGDECDALACFAGNVTRGTDALLRELRVKALVTRKAVRRG